MKNQENPVLLRAKQEAMRRYGDIIGMERPVSGLHPPLTEEGKAAQFLPFAALTGFEDAIHETQRLTEEKPELEESEKDLLDETFRELMYLLEKAEQDSGIEARITYFVQDERKSGGEILQKCAEVRKADLTRRVLILGGGEAIPSQNILKLEIIDSVIA